MGDAAQHGITGGMSHRVVDAFEVIHVDDGDHDLRAGWSSKVIQRSVKEPASVGKTCQSVETRQRHDLLLGLPLFGHIVDAQDQAAVGAVSAGDPVGAAVAVAERDAAFDPRFPFSVARFAHIAA